MRLEAYRKRKENLTAKYAAEEAISRNKCKFITEIIQGDLNVLQPRGGGAVAETDLIANLRNRGYLTSSEIKQIQGPGMGCVFDSDESVRVSTYIDTEVSHEDSDNDQEEHGPLTNDNRNSSSSSSSNRNLKNRNTERAAYAYLLDMPIRSLTDVKGNALLRDAEVTKAKLQSLRSKSEKDLWLADLDILATACSKMY